MNRFIRSASSAALIAGLSGALPAWAQVSDQPPAAEEKLDRVIVTGSLIRGSAEDAALPVEVFTADDLEKQGAPTALEFVKTLSISGPTTGEAYYFSGAALTGSVQFNLRGIGADKTLTLLNGKRVSENTSNIPSAAISRIEILKDGAAVTYGADATGGVVNFITREDFVGFEASAQYKYIDGSDGDYGISMLGGFGDGDANFLWSAEWEHRSQLETEQRDWAVTPYTTNPAPWSTLTNLAGYLALGAMPAYPGANGQGANTRAGEYGNAVSSTVWSDFTPDSCAAVGGYYVNSYTCNYNYIPYYNLVENQDIYRLYGQFNSRINDTTDFHLDASYGQVMVPEVYGSPSQPVTKGAARSLGATYQFYIPRTNPYFNEFAQRSGLAASPVYGSVQGISPVTYRAFAHGGNPYLGGENGTGTPSKIDNQVWRVSSSLSGELGEWAGVAKGVNYELSGTYNHSIVYSDAADIISYRLQEAMNGFGGANCRATDTNPYQFGTQNAAQAGQNGCLWWNPFASSFASQPELGLANPSYVAGSENSAELVDWIFDQRASEAQTQSLTVDLTFSGDTGIALPGGTIGWALGTQWRQQEYREQVFGDFYNGSTQCDWPSYFTTGNIVNGQLVAVSQTPTDVSSSSFTGCTIDGPGPFVYFGINEPDNLDQQQQSFFGELQIPVFDNLNLQAAVRREDFSGDLGATVYKVGGKWDVWGPISLRASYGTNYQAPELGLVPGEITNVNRSYTIANSNWRGGQTLTQQDITAETAKAWNAGVIFKSSGFAADHDFQLILDYFDIQTKDEIGEVVSLNDLASFLFPSTGPVPGMSGFYYADCNNPLISRVTFNDTTSSPGGTCIQGVTTSDNFSTIRTDYGNGPGQHTAGIDIQSRYSMPFFNGELAFDFTATRMTKLETGPSTLDGIAVNDGDDRLGYLNFATVASAAPKWRGTLFANYNWGDQNVRLQANYTSAVTDERAGVQYGENGEEWLTADIYYTLGLPDGLKLSLSAVNIFDRDPPPAQEELGYDPRLGSPLGRTFEIGIKKAF